MSETIPRFFTGTINNPVIRPHETTHISFGDDPVFEYYKELESLSRCDFIDEIYAQYERASTLHIQFCCSFIEPHKSNWDILKKLLPTAHIEVCRSWYASVRYCQKQDSTTVDIPRFYHKSNKVFIQTINDYLPETIYFYPSIYKGEKSVYLESGKLPLEHHPINCSGTTINHKFKYYWVLV